MTNTDTRAQALDCLKSDAFAAVDMEYHPAEPRYENKRKWAFNYIEEQTEKIRAALQEPTYHLNEVELKIANEALMDSVKVVQPDLEEIISKIEALKLEDALYTPTLYKQGKLEGLVEGNNAMAENVIAIIREVSNG